MGELSVKLLSAKVANFGSWKELEFDFDSIGLALVHGATGSGKSTLLDIVPWILFGQTAKGGSVEEVRSWQCDGESTIGRLSLRTGSGEITVCRTRGATGRNDLFWIESNGTYTEIRGKDLNDTQKLLENRLAISADTFLASSYYHEFSPTAAFFTAKAKDRRELFEHVCDLSFPLRLSQRCVDEKRSTKEIIGGLGRQVARLSERSDLCSKSLSDLSVRAENWGLGRLASISTFRDKSKTFEEEKAKKIKDLEAKSQAWEQKALAKVSTLAARLQELEALIKPAKDFELAEAKARNESRCGSCGALPENIAQLLEKTVADKFNNNQYIAELKSSKKELKELGAAINPHQGALNAAVTEVNTYADRTKEAEEAVNPFTEQVKDTEQALIQATQERDQAQTALESSQHRYDSLSHLYDLSFELRGQLIDKVIREIQEETNRYLETYFDAELRVNFSSKDADNLEVGIQKSGYDCSYTQLSKGQRQMLRVSFSVAVMASTANNSGISFSCLFFDETLDGLSTELKLKAYRLFESLSLSHSTVMVVDHCEELKSMFNTKLKIELIGDYSNLIVDGQA